MKIYTKTGDKGTTGLLTGQRVNKDSLRVEVYGTLDEVNSVLGMARSLCEKQEVKTTVLELQKFLMLLMADVASTGDVPKYVSDDHFRILESYIDQFDNKLQPLNHFIIPGESAGAGALDLARTTTRRAERLMWRLSREETLCENLMVSVNRLSDLCFVLSRVETELTTGE